MKKLRVLKDKLIQKSNYENSLDDSYWSPEKHSYETGYYEPVRSCLDRYKSPTTYIPLRQKETKVLLSNLKPEQNSEIIKEHGKVHLTTESLVKQNDDLMNLNEHESFQDNLQTNTFTVDEQLSRANTFEWHK